MSAVPNFPQADKAATDPSRPKVVHVSAFDVVGTHANGYLTHKWLEEHGYDSRMLVYIKKSADSGVRQLGSRFKRSMNLLLVRLERLLSSASMLPILSRRLEKDPWVKNADVVNLHLIHAEPFFSLLDLPRLSRKKRVVLSVHEMFFFTGHCVYSMDCERWKTGCGSCPDLELPFRIARDKTARNFKLKKWAFDHSDLDIVVTTRWTEERVSQSPILGRFRRHLIPFGIDSQIYKPADKMEVRRQLGVPEGAQVIAFRNSQSPRNFKGLDYILAALRLFQPSRPTVLLTFESVGGLDELKEKYQVIECGWVDEPKLARGLQAADIFLMPSTAESFGLMAVESMACGTPVIVCEGTALPETIGGPDCGVIVPQGDAPAFARAIGDCLNDPERLETYRQNGMRYVAEKHNYEDYMRRYLDLYQNLAKEKRN